MTETHATPPPGSPVFPPGRYGRRRAARPRRRWQVALLAAAAVALSCLIAVSLYQKYGNPDYDPQVVTYTDTTDTQIVITFRVAVPAGGSADCLLRARARDGAEVGRADVRVRARAGETSVTSSHRVATSRRAFVGEALRCRPAP